MPKLPHGAPISWSLRDRLAVFGLGGVAVAALYVVTVLARRDDSGRLYTRTWYWIDATPHLATVPAMIMTAAVGFALLIPLYRRRFGGVAVGLISLGLLTVEHYLLARLVGPVWQGPPFERWQMPLLGIALIAVAGGSGIALRDKVLGMERERSI